MNNAPSADAQVYLKDLMQAGQHAMKQFDNALTAVAGVDNQAPGSPGRSQFPLSLFIDLQRGYFKQVWHLWNAIFLQASSGGAHVSGTQAKADRRFKDKSWREQPYYDLLKQTYLLNSKRLHEFVDMAQVDDRTKLQLRFYARQFIVSDIRSLTGAS